MSQPAPIALFAFKRPQHLANVLECLARNPEFERSPLVIFCDGPRKTEDEPLVEATRQVARDFKHAHKIIDASDSNRGLAASISRGVSRLCSEYGRVIVVEDDLVLSAAFLNYVNGALDRYAGDERVMQVSGHAHISLDDRAFDACLLPMTTTWGWATWKRAWDHFDPSMRDYAALEADAALRRRFDLDGSYPYFDLLRAQRGGRADSWGIKWYLSVFMLNGLCVFPRHTLVDHVLDGSGTHCTVPQAKSRTLCHEPLHNFPPASLDAQALVAMKRHLKADRRLWRRVGRYLLHRIWSVLGGA